MNINKFEASLTKALEGIQEAVAAMKEEVAVRVPDEDVLSAEEGGLTHRRLLHATMFQAQAEMGCQWDKRLTDGNAREIAINSMRQFSDGTPAMAMALVKLMNAVVQWHNEIPTLKNFERAVTEMSDTFDGEASWHLLDIDHGLFEEPAQAVFWRSCDYITLHAAEADGATYGTEGKAHSVETARMYAQAVSEVWGHQNSLEIAVAFSQ